MLLKRNDLYVSHMGKDQLKFWFSEVSYAVDISPCGPTASP